MNYLLDTHYVLWTLFKPEVIDKNIQEILLDPEKIKFVSGVTFWEISLKYSLGKLELKDSSPTEVFAGVVESGFEVETVSPELYSSLYNLPPKKNHKDPFDRMLIRQAISNDYVFITKDKSIEAYKENGLKLVLGT